VQPSQNSRLTRSQVVKTIDCEPKVPGSNATCCIPDEVQGLEVYIIGIGKGGPGPPSCQYCPPKVQIAKCPSNGVACLTPTS